MFFVRNRTLVLLLVTGFLGALSGCASTGQERAAAAAGSLNNLSNIVQQTEGQLQSAVVALTDLVERPKPDLRPQYQTYVAAMKALDERVSEMNAQSEKIKAKGQEYFAAWEKESATIQSEELKEHAAERREKLSTRYDAIRAEVARVVEIGKPLVVSLKDVETVLNLDLTPKGLENAAKPAKQARASAADLKPKVENLRKQLGEVSNLLAPQAVEKAAAPPAETPAKK